MCGIAGSHNSNRVNIDCFNKQLQSIIHRGPDDSGIWENYNSTIALGSRRLAIQDLSANGHMPMLGSDGRYIIVFNGEIYNFPELKKTLIQKGFSFKSNSDTEGILLAYILWGPKCLEYLDGMFAIAIYDNETKDLFIARDRAGEKPLYYWKHPDGFDFGSELKVLFQNPLLKRKINPVALKQYFSNGYTLGEVSFIKDVYKLPAAHYLIYNTNSLLLSVNRYWSIPKLENHTKSKEELTEELDGLLSGSVKRQMLSDVPLGVLLSGGVDSSLVTAYAAEHTQKVKTFHISFEGFGKYNESAYAKQIANYYDTEHIELSGNELSFDLIDKMLDYYDEPMADSSMLPTFLVSQLTKKYVTVALGGDGGDELFGGYTNYRIASDHKKYKKIPQFVRSLIASSASLLPSGIKGRNFLMTLPGDEYDRFLYNRLFDNGIIKSSLHKDIWKEIGKLNVQSTINKSGDFIYDMTKFDFENSLAEDMLVKIDRASMALSLEMRAPFLSKDVIEFAFSQVPDYLKTDNSSLKILPKDLLKKKLKIDFDVERKQGFSIPLNEWIGNKWAKDFYNEINCFPEIIDKKYALSLFDNIKKGYSNSSKLYSLVILSKWIKKYNIEV
jgi:asparagine synthase (glutamine-hydrolysing)